MARESASIPGLVDLNTTVDIADRKTQEVTIPPAPQVPEAQILQAKPQRELPNVCVHHHMCIFFVNPRNVFVHSCNHSEELHARVLFMHVRICT